MKTVAIGGLDPVLEEQLLDGNLKNYAVSGDADIECEIVTAYIKYHGENRNYRPLLYIVAKPQSLIPYGDTDLGNDITSLYFDDNVTGPMVMTALYDFTPNQLVTLVKDYGYFNKSFDVKNLEGVSFLLPAEFNATVIEPIEEAGSPIVSVEIIKPLGINLDLESSGYDFTELLPKLELEDDLVDETEMETESELDETYETDDLLHAKGDEHDILADVDPGEYLGSDDEIIESQQDDDLQVKTIIDKDGSPKFELPVVPTKLFDQIIETGILDEVSNDSSSSGKGLERDLDVDDYTDATFDAYLDSLDSDDIGIDVPTDSDYTIVELDAYEEPLDSNSAEDDYPIDLDDEKAFDEYLESLDSGEVVEDDDFDLFDLDGDFYDEDETIAEEPEPIFADEPLIMAESKNTKSTTHRKFPSRVELRKSQEIVEQEENKAPENDDMDMDF